MSRAKETSAYPRIFLDIADALTEDKTRKFELHFDSRAAAMSARQDFYMFKTVAIKEGLAKEGAWPEIKAFYMDVPGVKNWAGIATIMHNDYSPAALRMQESYDKVMKERKQ